MANPDGFALALNSARVARGVSLNELAARMKLTATYLRYMESGTMPPPPVDVVLRLSHALHAPATEMLRLAISQRESVELAVPRARGEGVLMLAADIAEAWPLVTEGDALLRSALAVVRARG